MKVISVEIDGFKTRIYVDNKELVGVREFTIHGGVDFAPTMEIDQFIIDDELPS